MSTIFALLSLAGFYPIFRAWRVHRHTSLAHAVMWAGVAWAAWGLTLTLGTTSTAGLDPWRYLALCLTGAAGVAVLGAQRPRVGAWDMVVLGLLLVMLLPLQESLVLGTLSMDGPRGFFLMATLAVATLNYVPTAFSSPALLLCVICLGECVAQLSPTSFIGPQVLDVMHLCLLTVPWLGLLSRRRRRTPHRVDELWFRFRDAYGLFWAQRVREQYNRATANAGLPGRLYWQGCSLDEKEKAPTEEQWREMEGILAALMGKFF